jgi:hypothetical protein
MPPAPLFALALTRNGAAWWTYFIAAAIAFGPWGLALAWVYWEWPGRDGVKWSLLSLAVLMGYLFGSLAALFIVGLLVLSSGNVLQIIFCALTLAVLAGALWAARRGDRMVGEACIRRYLAGAAASADPHRSAEDEQAVRG